MIGLNRVTQSPSNNSSEPPIFAWLGWVLALILTIIVVYLIYRQRKIKLDFDLPKTARPRKTLPEVAIEQDSTAERLQSLGQLTGRIAHDLNNFITVIRCNAEQLESYVNDPELCECIDGIFSTSDSIEELSQRLLADSGSGSTEFKVVEINTIVEAFLKSCRCKLGNRHQIKLIQSTNPLFLNGNPYRIEKTLCHLLTNAIAATKDRNRVIEVKIAETSPAGKLAQRNLECERDPKTEAHPTVVTIGAIADEQKYVSISVIDKGEGIEQSQISKLFGPFSSNGKFKFRGLGLSVVYQNVIDHKGFLRVGSQLGCGTTVTVCLPVVDRSNNLKSTPSIGSAKAQNKGVIAIIDNQDPVVESVERLMSDFGWKSLKFTNGMQAVSYLGKIDSAIRPDVILLDVVMPEQNGFECLEELSKRKIDTPVIVMSGVAKMNLETFRSNASVVATIRKPFSGAALDKLIDHNVPAINAAQKPPHHDNCQTALPDNS